MCATATTNVDEYRFWGVFWVDVSTTTTAEKGFKAIGDRFKLPKTSIDNVRQSLANTKQAWLLILDNADDPNVDYQQYFPSGNVGVIIMTSRNSECHQYATGARAPINLPGLEPSAAQKLLLSAARISPDRHGAQEQEAKAVATSLLGGHPLALIQAGAYVSQGHCSLAQYPLVFERQRKRLLEFRPKQAQSRYGDVYATFESSAEALGLPDDEWASDALSLLSVLSMLANSRLPLSLFRTAWERAQHIPTRISAEDDEGLEQLAQWHVSRLLPLLQVEGDVWDPFRLIEAARRLEAYSLLVLDGMGDTMSISMHPLTHAWARDRQDVQAQQQSWLRAACLTATSGLDRLFWITDQLLLRPHLQSVISLQQSVMWSSGPQIMIVRLMVLCGWRLLELRMDKDLFDLTQRLFTWLGVSSETVNKRWLVLYGLAGRNLRNCGQSKDAVSLLEQILRIKKQSLAENHPSRLSSQHELAVAYRNNGQMKEAIVLLEKVVKIREQSLAKDHPDRLASQHALAGAYQDNRQEEEAVRILEEVIKIKKQSLGEDHPSRLASQHNLAICLWEIGERMRPLDMMRQVVHIRRQVLDSSHPSQQDSEDWLAIFEHETTTQTTHRKTIPSDASDTSVTSNTKRASKSAPRSDAPRISKPNTTSGDRRGATTRRRRREKMGPKSGGMLRGALLGCHLERLRPVILKWYQIDQMILRARGRRWRVHWALKSD